MKRKGHVDLLVLSWDPPEIPTAVAFSAALPIDIFGSTTDPWHFLYLRPLPPWTLVVTARFPDEWRDSVHDSPKSPLAHDF